MANDKHVSVDEVIGTSKIRLVVTGETSADVENVPVDADQLAADVERRSTELNAAHSNTSQSNTSQSSTDQSNTDRSSTDQSKTDQSTTSQSSTSRSHDAEQSIQLPDADKLLRELPVDEFFKVLERATSEQLQSIIHTFEKSARTTRGSKILSKVIEVPSEPRTFLSLVAWWEWRRPLYNLILALVGLPSILILTYAIGLPLLVTVMGGIAYLVMANICYTLGTPAELVARTIYKEKAETYGPVLLTLGTIFSVLLTIVLELFVVLCMLAGKFAPFLT